MGVIIVSAFFFVIFVYALCNLLFISSQKKNGNLFKHKFEEIHMSCGSVIPIGATYISTKNNGEMLQSTGAEMKHFPETVDGDEYYFCQNLYVFNSGHWTTKSIKDPKNVLTEINGHSVVNE